jgi:hypothetical protein
LTRFIHLYKVSCLPFFLYLLFIYYLLSNSNLWAFNSLPPYLNISVCYLSKLWFSLFFAYVSTVPFYKACIFPSHIVSKFLFSSFFTVTALLIPEVPIDHFPFCYVWGLILSWSFSWSSDCLNVVKPTCAFPFCLSLITTMFLNNLFVVFVSLLLLLLLVLVLLVLFVFNSVFHCFVL